MRKLVFFILLLTYTLSALDKEKVTFAINCGGDEYTSEDGIKYEKDAYYDAGVSSDYGLNYDINNTKDMDIYQTERWHTDTFTYSIPLKEPGKYILILKFSEVYFSAANEKVFDVALGRKAVIRGLDVFAAVGKAAAHDEFVEFELKDDKIYFNRAEAQGAYDASNKLLKVKFVKGAKDNPKINAIVLYKGDIMGKYR
jgi:hypothetical protein